MKQEKGSQRLDEVTKDEWERFLAALPRVMAKKAFGTDEYRELAQRRYDAILNAIWETGCHPSVMSNPKKWGVQVRSMEGEPVMKWFRPKKKMKHICVMPVSQATADKVNWLSENGSYTTRQILRVFVDLCEASGVLRVTPRTIRHTVGWQVFRKHGPSAAKESLGVSDHVLQFYLAMNAETRVRVIREGRQSDHKPSLATVESKEG